MRQGTELLMGIGDSSKMLVDFTTETTKPDGNFDVQMRSVEVTEKRYGFFATTFPPSDT
jgi:hypothetical protein